MAIAVADSALPQPVLWLAGSRPLRPRFPGRVGDRRRGSARTVVRLESRLGPPAIATQHALLLQNVRGHCRERRTRSTGWNGLPAHGKVDRLAPEGGVLSHLHLHSRIDVQSRPGVRPDWHRGYVL